MCTAISYQNGDHYFGRNLDLNRGYEEQVTITPRNYTLHFRNGQNIFHHYAMIGMATIANDYPLYYEATNEKGLSMAALNFPGNAAYHFRASGTDNIAPFELIPWVLSQCANAEEAAVLLRKVNVWMLPFSREYLLTPLHWMLSDNTCTLVVESVQDGLKIYDDPVGVLTNSPSFLYHMDNLANYKHLSNQDTMNHFCGIRIDHHSEGLGATGLPGDFSSASRFVKASFVKCNSKSDILEKDNVSQFFHLLSSVAMPRGSVVMGNGEPEITLYSSCCNTDKGIYYYTTYENSRITAVNMHHENLNIEALITYPLRKFSEIFVQN